MNMKLYVGGLDGAVSDKDLEEYFAAQGKVVSAVVIKDRDSGQSKGFGFVEMEDAEEAKQAIAELNGKIMGSGSKPLVVSEARPREDRRS